MPSYSVIFAPYHHGRAFSLQNAYVSDMTLINAVDPIGAELQIGTAEFSVTVPLENDGSIMQHMDELRYGDALSIHDYTTGDVIPGEYYVKTVTKTSPRRYKVEAHDFAGIFNDIESMGVCESTASADYSISEIKQILKSGLVGQDFMVQRVESIINYIEPADIIAGQKFQITGYIKPGTLREVFQNLLFSLNLTAVKELFKPVGVDTLLNGFLVLKPATTLSSSPVIDENIYNDGSVEFTAQPVSISVTSHNYSWNSATDPQELVYESQYDRPEEDAVIWMNDGLPAWDYVLQSTDGVLFPDIDVRKNRRINIHRMGARFWGKGKIYVKRFSESTSVHTLKRVDTRLGESVSVDNTAVTDANINQVLEKLKAYYFSDRTEVKVNFIWSGEHAGQAVTVKDSIGRTTSGFIADMSQTYSAKIRCDCTLHADWTPYSPARYSKCLILTGSGEWQVPDGIGEMMAVLIGGGAGGYSGTKGEDGKNAKVITRGSTKRISGKTGENGGNGSVITQIINDPAPSYVYSCGLGGAGGIECASTSTANPGAPGTETRFGEYSSADGTTSSTGYKNVINGEQYAYTMVNVFMPDRDTSPDVYRSGFFEIEETDDGLIDFFDNHGTLAFQSVELVHGVRTLRTIPGLPFDSLERFDFGGGDFEWVIGGAPGGSAYMAQGKAGTRCIKRGWWDVLLGNGGDGATPARNGFTPLEIVRNAFGCGGLGGFGGGAGGDAGAMFSNDAPEYVNTAGIPGVGANGSAGGDGAPGCVIIYYSGTIDEQTSMIGNSILGKMKLGGDS